MRLFDYMCDGAKAMGGFMILMLGLAFGQFVVDTARMPWLMLLKALGGE